MGRATSRSSCTRPYRWRVTRPTFSRIRRCLEIAGRDTANGAASCPTDARPSARRATIARRVGSASAEKTASSGCACELTIWLTLEQKKTRVKPGRARHASRDSGLEQRPLFAEERSERGTLVQGREVGGELRPALGVDAVAGVKEVHELRTDADVADRELLADQRGVAGVELAFEI